MKLIRNTLLIFVLLYVGYNLFLIYVKPVPGKGQHQWQQNVIAAQEYVDFNREKPVVIAGSSLSFRMQPNMLPDSIYNLSFGGGSVLTGLDIVRQSASFGLGISDKNNASISVRPRVVYAELNVAIRAGDPKMVSTLFRPFVADMRRVVPALQEKNQPVNLLQPLLAKFSKAGAKKGQPDDPALMARRLENSLKEYQTVPDEKMLEKNIPAIREMIRDLDSMGIKVVLYLMPVHCQIRNSPHYNTLVPRLKKEFPESQYTWLPEADCHNYEFTDGIHLTYESAMRFSQWFAKQKQ